MKSTSSSLTSSRLAPEHLWRLGLLAFVTALALVTLAHALLGFDAGRLEGWLPGCLFRTVTGIACPGCGMTHALLALSQLRLAESFAAHPAAIPLVLAAALALVRPVALRPQQRTLLSAVAVVALLSLWAWRLPSS
jgi:hypothetical protein